MPNQTCEMLVGYLADEHGDAGEEVYCTKVATHHYEGTRCCPACADGMRKEGFPIFSLGEKPS